MGERAFDSDSVEGMRRFVDAVFIAVDHYGGCWSFEQMDVTGRGIRVMIMWVPQREQMNWWSLGICGGIGCRPDCWLREMFNRALVMA